METPTNEISENSTLHSNDVDHKIQNHENLVSDLPNHGVLDSTHEFAEDEVRGILEVIAATGKYWHEWEKLKNMLSFYLKQILSKYPHSQMTTVQQESLLGEAYEELLKRLEDALCSFVEGPPFTLQRLCEILLGAQSIYPRLSKLALALEKNLFVTSTLTISTDPYPPTVVREVDESDKVSEEPQLQSNTVQNGVEPTISDADEIMTEVDEAEAEDDMTIDMETFEEIVGSSETNSTPTSQT